MMSLSAALCIAAQVVFAGDGFVKGARETASGSVEVTSSILFCPKIDSLFDWAGICGLLIFHFIYTLINSFIH